MPSPFLAIPETAWVASNDLAFAIRDRYPVSPGHTLVIPRREVPTWFEATAEERAALFALVDEVKRRLDAELVPSPDGYNLGINAGEAAGQTVMHLHVHVIPRYRGDVDDPRGGVRHLIPGRGNYLVARPPPPAVPSPIHDLPRLATNASGDRFLRHLAPLFGAASDVAILAAFVQKSGLNLLATSITAALTRGARVRLITGDYLNVTDPEALQRLLDWVAQSAALPDDGGGRFEARVVEMATLAGEARSFHPKSWRFEGPGWGTAFVGSSNISSAALGTGIEWNLRVDLDSDPVTFQRVVEAFETWWDRAKILDPEWVTRYAARPRRLPPPPGEPAAEVADLSFEGASDTQVNSRRKARTSDEGELERAYLEALAQRGDRPTAANLFHLGCFPDTQSNEHGSWFDFVKAMGHLTAPEARALERARHWLLDLEFTPMSKSYKMVVLEVLLEADALHDGLPLPDLARRSHAWLERSPDLFRDLAGVKALPDPRQVGSAFLRYWNGNPVKAWTGREASRDGHVWFRREFRAGEEWLVPILPLPEDAEATGALMSMMRELNDYRLAQYRARSRDEAARSFEAKVTWNQRTPILKLPSRDEWPDRPTGDVDIELPDGSTWQFRFQKEFCNVAHPVGTEENRLPELLREWFGPDAGWPRTRSHVRFLQSPQGHRVEPVREAQQLGKGALLLSFPTLAVAAGAPGAPGEHPPDADRVRLPTQRQTEGLFAVRAYGDSMNGGPHPIEDGDWLIMRPAQGVGLGALQGQVVLVQTPEDARGFGNAYQVKRIVRGDAGWMLRSDNPAYPSYPASEGLKPNALLVEVVAPRCLAPEPGALIAEDDVGRAFGLNGEPRPQHAERIEGHLFLMVEEKMFVGRGRIRWDVPSRRPGETAFVLVRTPQDERWQYLGVGRWSTEESVWRCPELNDSAWKILRQDKGVSRSLQERFREQAMTLVDHIIHKYGEGTVVETAQKRLRILGKTKKGGLKIDGAGGFGERTVTLTDIGWVLATREHIRQTGAPLDVAQVNQQRYLKDTHERSTRYIDTPLAILLVNLSGI